MLVRVAHLLVPVAARRDVEVALDFVALEAAVDAAGVDGLAALESRRFDELAAALAHVAQDVSDV